MLNNWWYTVHKHDPWLLYNHSFSTRDGNVSSLRWPPLSTQSLFFYVTVYTYDGHPFRYHDTLTFLPHRWVGYPVSSEGPSSRWFDSGLSRYPHTLSPLFHNVRSPCRIRFRSFFLLYHWDFLYLLNSYWPTQSVSFHSSLVPNLRLSLVHPEKSVPFFKREEEHNVNLHPTPKFIVLTVQDKTWNPSSKD